MLVMVPCQLNIIDFKDTPEASEGNYIANKLILLKWLLWLQKESLLETPI